MKVDCHTVSKGHGKYSMVIMHSVYCCTVIGPVYCCTVVVPQSHLLCKLRGEVWSNRFVGRLVSVGWLHVCDDARAWLL